MCRNDDTQNCHFSVAANQIDSMRRRVGPKRKDRLCDDCIDAQKEFLPALFPSGPVRWSVGRNRKSILARNTLDTYYAMHSMGDMATSNFSSELVRSSTDLVILTLLRDRPMYGYEILVTLADRGNGEFQFKQGTLYPLLYRLEREGWIRAKWEIPPKGKKRKVYSLTAEGKKGTERGPRSGSASQRPSIRS